MTYNEETEVLNNLKQIKTIVKDNNKLLKDNNLMLKQIINYITETIRTHNKENEEDFIRNVLANLVSNGLNIK